MGLLAVFPAGRNKGDVARIHDKVVASGMLESQKGFHEDVEKGGDDTTFL